MKRTLNKSNDAPNIGLDIDGTITAFPQFFSALSQCWKGDVYAVTYRIPNRERDMEELRLLGVMVKDILYAEGTEHKAVLCEEYGIDVLFDDMPEFLVHCKPSMAAFLVRDEHNFDHNTKQYVFGKHVGRIAGAG